MSLLYLIEERQLMFFSKPQHTDNIFVDFNIYQVYCTDGKIWNAGTGSQLWTEWRERGIVYY